MCLRVGLKMFSAYSRKIACSTACENCLQYHLKELLTIPPIKWLQYRPKNYLQIGAKSFLQNGQEELITVRPGKNVYSSAHGMASKMNSQAC